MHRLHRLALIAALIALCVIVLGAWVRLSHAGLGCPDWPGCYGQMTWPDASQEIAAANEAFPDRPVETDKAWREMVHRYLAGSLILLVLAINWVAWRGGRSLKAFRGFAAVLLLLIIFQALLGMWTVTLKLKPIIVMGHLLGGMATLAMLTWLSAKTRPAFQVVPVNPGTSVRRWLLAAIVVLCAQIALGGWTSANYAALSCPDLPTCGGEWWPDMDFTEGFVLWREVGVDYEGGILDQSARAAIHISHRIGAVVTLLVLLVTGLKIKATSGLRRYGMIIMGLVSLQFLLGVMNIALKLPLANAVAHNGVAALLLATLTWTWCSAFGTNRQ